MTPITSLPDIRVRTLSIRPPLKGRFVLYWMLAQRRVNFNFALERAAAWAAQLNCPLLVLESVTLVYEFASSRQHTFLLQGMADNQSRLVGLPVTYYPFVERIPGERGDLLRALISQASVVVVDDFPMAMHQELVTEAAHECPCRLEAVDSCGLLPLRATEITYPTAFAFRRFLQKNLREHLSSFPAADPLKRVNLPKLKLDDRVMREWPAADPNRLLSDTSWMNDLPLLSDVKPVAICGGTTTAEKTLRSFLKEKLAHYAHERNSLDHDCSSGLSPYLHFGHIGVHQVFAELAKQERWNITKLADTSAGKKEGWWGMSDNSESFLDELLTWRELGYNFNHLRDDFKDYSSLPPWALKTLNQHRNDKRIRLYSTAQFEQAATHDPLWNAAQTQLVREGKIHNYLRMLWGKKILEWSKSPENAIEIMIELNDKYALDGRDPNSYSGIFWCLGRYDRPWFPEREIFGNIRFMSSENTARKMNVKNYIEKYSP